MCLPSRTCKGHCTEKENIKRKTIETFVEESNILKSEDAIKKIAETGIVDEEVLRIEDIHFEYNVEKEYQSIFAPVSEQNNNGTATNNDTVPMKFSFSNVKPITCQHEEECCPSEFKVSFRNNKQCLSLVRQQNYVINVFTATVLPLTIEIFKKVQSSK